MTPFMNLELSVHRHAIRWEKLLQFAIFMALASALYASVSGDVFQPLWQSASILSV